VHPFAFTPGGRNAGLAEIGEVAGDFWLARAQDFHKVADANLAVRDEVQQAKPRGIGERAEQEIEREVHLRLWHVQSIIHHIRLDRYVRARVTFRHIRRCGYVLPEATVASGDIRDVVKSKYGEAARRVRAGEAAGCGCSDSQVPCCDPISADLYDASETAGLPRAALSASLGCGNPTALAQLNSGEHVLDLGSGGGIDVLLSAKRVGPNGKAYGLDMTDEMLALARENQRKAGVGNVEFLKGEIENIPLPENSVDVVISNCVINLSADKDRVLREAFRVLRPGGRFAVSDVVVRGPVPADIRRNVELWVGCVAGALDESEYRAKLDAAGFAEVEIEPTRVYSIEDARQFLTAKGIDVEAIAPHVEGKFASAFIRAKKPGAHKSTAEGSCCTPACCAPAEPAKG
jgi:arsenite methyltransferase